MIEIICRGKSLSEAKTKCMVAEILFTEKNIPIDMTTNVLNAIGGIHIAESKE